MTEIQEKRLDHIAAPRLHEDWVATLMGGLVIGLALMGLLKIAGMSFEVLAGCVGVMVMLLAAYFGRQAYSSKLMAFALVMALNVAAQWLSEQQWAKQAGLEIVLFSLLVGLAVGNLVPLPKWIREGLNGEFFVKIGLVLLGTSVLFGDLLKHGALGMVQAVVVVMSVWGFSFWLCRRLKLDEELSFMLSSAVSICGVSAAIATSGAIQGDKRKLSYVISLVLITAVPMMMGMPYLAQWLGLSPQVTGAWIGGSIDTSGAVAAASSLAGDEALKASTIVKFSQNVLLGLAATGISLYWSISQVRRKVTGQVKNPGISQVWERFPKFVIGFVLASLCFSFVLAPEVVKGMKTGLKEYQTWFFALGFTSIGLETRFKELMNQEGWRPLLAFLVAQSFNVLLTLGMAIWLFS